jgi:hypothetical protein
MWNIECNQLIPVIEHLRNKTIEPKKKKRDGFQVLRRGWESRGKGCGQKVFM